MAPPQPPQPRTPGARLPQLDGLRAVAFTGVFLHHTVAAPLMWAGVDLFFVLSGYLITGILLRQPRGPGFFTGFYLRRFFRILPPYYAVLLLAFLFFSPPGQDRWGWYLAFMSNISDALWGRPDGLSVLDPMWSLAVEEQFYLLWPLLVYFLGPRGLWWTSWILVAVAPLLRLIVAASGESYVPVYELTFTRIDLLAAGALLALGQRAEPELFRRWSRYGPVLTGAAMAVFLALAVTYPKFRTGANSLTFLSMGYTLVTIGMAGTVAYLVVPRGTLLERLLSLRPLTYLGSISYVMYLFHQMAIELVARRGFKGLPLTVLALALTVAVAALSWRFFERPFQELRERLFPSAASRPAAAG